MSKTISGKNTMNEEKTSSSSGGSDGRLKWVTKPEEAVIIDDSFWVKRQSWGTFVSVDINGNGIVTSYTEEGCIQATRWYLKAKQDGFEEVTTYKGVVGSKL